VPTFSIRETPDRFNLKKVNVKVTAHEVKKGGFFSSDYAVFQIETEMPEQRERIKVQRKDADLYTLRRLLKVLHPYIMIPPLPLKNTKLMEKVLNRR